MSSTGPSIRSVCRILNRNSCGSGSICGIDDEGHALILSNAHVTGTRPREIIVDVESTGDRINARIIKAAYSDKILADWSLSRTVDPYTKVEPVKLSKKRPRKDQSGYTKGFPRCQAFPGTDIRTTFLSASNALWRWQPDSISGQSGSPVFLDHDDLQYGLLTWSWGNDGAGQMTHWIYKQERSQTLIGMPRVAGLIELGDEDSYDFTGIERPEDATDPGELDIGFTKLTALEEFPIWAEDEPVDPIQPDPQDPDYVRILIERMTRYHRDNMELHEKWLDIWEGANTPNTGGTGMINPGPGETFGLE